VAKSEFDKNVEAMKKLMARNVEKNKRAIAKAAARKAKKAGKKKEK
jgi:hypothetical protein